MIADIICGIFMLIGGAFMFLGAVGIMRMPDLLTRMQTATKPPTLGVLCLMISVAFYFGDIGVTARAMMISFFVFLTAPVAAHMIARAGYQVGVAFWKGTVIDELKDKYRDSTIHS